jgi:hypothetical protein
MVVDGDPCGRRQRRGEVDRPASLVVGSSGEAVLEDGAEVGLCPALDSDKDGWWQLVMVSRDGGGAEQSVGERAK